MNPVMFNTGGTNMISVVHVGVAVIGAIEYGQHGERFLVGDVNMAWKDMLSLVLQAMGENKRIVTIPTQFAAIYGRNLKMKETKEGKESGLDPTKFMQDIQSRFTYFDPAPFSDALGYSRGGLEEAIIKTIKACL
jgi:dihydroflavonol-4-reductase